MKKELIKISAKLEEANNKKNSVFKHYLIFSKDTNV